MRSPKKACMALKAVGPGPQKNQFLDGSRTRVAVKERNDPR